MSKSEFIKWLLELKGEIAKQIADEKYSPLYSDVTMQSLYDQNHLLAEIINAAQDINSAN